MTHDQEREKFEAWATDRWLDVSREPRDKHAYAYVEVDYAWLAWQAAKREPVVSPNVIAHDNPMFRPYCFIVEPHRSDDCSWPWNVHKTEAECERDLEDGRVIVPVYRHPALKHPLPEAMAKDAPLMDVTEAQIAFTGEDNPSDDYKRGYRHGYMRCDMEIRGCLV